MKKVFLIVVVYGCILLLSCNHSKKATNSVDSRPNIIFILADDLGYGDLGVTGQQKIETPGIDKLAAGGMRFTQFYCGTSVCAPSRSSLMTGQHTGHTPIRGNLSAKPEGQFPLKAEAVTIAEVLKGAGYTTADFGKWGLGFVGTEGDPLNQGFSTFYGYNCQTEAHNYFPDHLWNNDKRVELPNTENNKAVYAADDIHNKAIEFLGQKRVTPFFMFLSYTLPHAALQLPHGDSLLEYYKKKFNEAKANIPESIKKTHYEPQLFPHAAYAAMVGRLDRYVNDVVDKVKKLGIERNTIIIFASDNGPHIEGGNDPEFFNSRGGLRGNKRSLYEGGIRTPFIVYAPGIVKPGINNSYRGAFWDVFPTLAQVAGVKNLNYPIDGISFLPALLGKKQPQHEYLYWEFHEEGGRQAVRMGKWKAIRQNAMSNKNGAIELYDMNVDESEKHNIASSYPGIVAQLQKIIQEAHVENKDFPFFK